MDIVDNQKHLVKKGGRPVSSIQPPKPSPESDEPISSDFIRTMAQDMAVLGIKDIHFKEVKPEKKPAPDKKPERKPVDIPTTKSIVKLEPKLPQKEVKKSPVKPPIPKPKVKIKKPRKKLNLRLVLPALVVLALVIGGVFYWLNKGPSVVEPETHYECQNNVCVSVQGPGDNQCQSSLECQQTTNPLIPKSLIIEDETKTIGLVAGQENLLQSQLTTLTEQEQASSTINRVLVKTDETDYFSLDKLISTLGISIPESIATSTTGDYTMFLYSQGTGNRLGLVIKMGQSDTLVSDLNKWEGSIKDDLNVLFPAGEMPSPATDEFLDNVHKDVYIRYLNFPTPDLSLDYALVKGNLVITTSKESMFAIIDNLLSMPDEPQEAACAKAEETCGGIGGILCCDELTCQLDGQNPNASGVCTKEDVNSCQDLCGDNTCQENVCQGPDCPCTETFQTCPNDCLENICDDLCGDGICQKIVCQGTGCPCAETFETCPIDCFE